MTLEKELEDARYSRDYWRKEARRLQDCYDSYEATEHRRRDEINKLWQRVHKAEGGFGRLKGLYRDLESEVEQLRNADKQLRELIKYLAWHCWDAHKPAGGNCTVQSIIEGSKFGAEQGWHLKDTEDVTV